MYESDDEYSFVVLSRVNSIKKVRLENSLLIGAREKLGKTQKYQTWKFIGRSHENALKLHKV